MRDSLFEFSRMYNPLKLFRLIAFIEGVSFLVLLFIAMPLKYWAGLPLAVRVVGTAHGVLFVLFIISLLDVMIRYRWSLLRGAVIFLSSLIPFGTFAVDYYWLRKAEA